MERRRFTREFKLEAVKLIKERGVSYAQAATDLGVAHSEGVPHRCAPYCGTAYTRIDDAATAAQADALASAALTTVVRLPNADHYIWHSNEADVVREMNAFLARLEKATPSSRR